MNEYEWAWKKSSQRFNQKDEKVIVLHIVKHFKIYFEQSCFNI